MKKQSMYIRLQNQYKKLSSRIQKSIKNGKFYQYTQFKQEQLLARLKRYSLQMKQVAMGMAVVGALGVTTPAAAQYVPPAFLQHDGAANPIEGLLTLHAGDDTPEFVDIDGDGDYDMFTVENFYDASISYNSKAVKYHENQGSATVPNFVAITGAANPLDSVIQFKALEFVDIDNDGDLDLFAGASTASYYNPTPSSVYFENTGSVNAPVFTQRLGASNPLNILNTHLTTLFSEVNVSFVDIDNDGDKDCFAAIHIQTSPQNKTDEIWYYKNIGTVSSPVFTQQTAVNNPLNGMSTALQPTPNVIRYLDMEFQDMDKDGDMDAFLLGTFVNHKYFENTGTVSTPSFGATFTLTGDPLDSIQIGTHRISLVDIDNDGDLDAFGKTGQYTDDFFYENLDSTVLGTAYIEEEVPFTIYPNPTAGVLNFEKNITGLVSLCTITGQLLVQQQLNNEQQFNISELDNGLYFLYIETGEMRIRKKVLIQK
jgi:hypothetical protein